MMKVRIAASVLVMFGPLAFSSAAFAANLPGIAESPTNKVEACVTPGRLTAFLSSRNTQMDDKYAKIAVDYMRHGEDLGVRWDYAFFQMIVETATLRYTGDVKPKQNNFAGLGATGGGVRGESFDSVSSGVRAHLEHVLMYTGKHIDDPVAERTRKVQEWGVLNKWRRGISGPMTFTHLTRKWSPGDRGYSRDIEAIANLFFEKSCKQADPNPEMIAEARAGRTKTTQQANVQVAKTTKVATLAPSSRSLDLTNTAKAKTIASPQNLGAAELAGEKRKASDGTATVAILNSPKKDEVAPAANLPSKTTTPSNAPDSEKSSDPSGSTKKSAAGSSNCRVWTASYGGAKALIIRAKDKGITNYTVLDVNSGRETREADAYIAAYAKGGKTVGEYPSPETALKQAFELCPEG